MVSIGDTLKESEQCIAIAQTYPEVFATCGVHPHHAKDWMPEDLQNLRSMIESSDRVKAVGEIGLDYHYEFSPIDTQRQVFASQLTLAKDLGLPVVVHCREAVQDVWAIVREFVDLKMVLHCCTEKWEDAESFVATGHLLSFTGIATYPNAADIRETIKQCPLSQIMIETDAPYLAPIPHRGKRNEPAFVTEVAKCIAEIKGISLEEVGRVTTQNAVEFFKL